jgi:hypothetical protein
MTDSMCNAVKMVRKKETRSEPLGEIARRGDGELQECYEILKKAHEEHLKPKGVELTAFRRGGLYTQRSLALIALYIRLGQPVTKRELTNFVRKYVEGEADVQDGRHLANTQGWYVLSTQRNDVGTETWPKDSYGLISITDCYPSFSGHREGNLESQEWARLLEKFENRCSLCGSEEGKNNLRNKSVITQLQQGHKDPTKPLSPSNCLPQCQECNRPLQQKFIFDDKGRPKAISKADLIFKSPRNIQIEVFRLLKAEFDE